jgi:hypothetical protein
MLTGHLMSITMAFTGPEQIYGAGQRVSVVFHLHTDLGLPLELNIYSSYLLDPKPMVCFIADDMDW